MTRPRIALFAHSTNPRGGVVHAMQLAEALCNRGHDATLIAPAAGEQAFFRAPRCAWLTIPVSPAPRDVVRLVGTRRQEIAAFLRGPGAGRFDILHAQDSLSALALSDLVGSGCIPSYFRTVHHLDRFEDPRLSGWQDEAVTNASELFCVSRLWQRELERRFDHSSTLVGNGVDAERFTPRAAPGDALLRRRLLPRGGRMVLALGGIEARKNTLATLRAFLLLMRQNQHPDLHLVIAGGASLLDHAGARLHFDAILRGSEHAGRVVLAGVVDDPEMSSLYRIASVLCFPSLEEGFGLCVLEALASGIPVVAPHGPPFDEYLGEGDAILVDPASDSAIAGAVARALLPEALARARHHGPARALDFSWQHVAGRHLARYSAIQRERPFRSWSRMPEMRFRVRWPDGSESLCYSPSLVIEEHLSKGARYSVAEFLGRATTALGVASERVRQKYGMPCVRAQRQIEQINHRAAAFAGDEAGAVTILEFER